MFFTGGAGRVHARTRASRDRNKPARTDQRSLGDNIVKWCAFGPKDLGEFEEVRTLTTNQGVNFGAEFITFNVDGNPKKATSYFKTISGTRIDDFTIFAD